MKRNAARGLASATAALALMLGCGTLVAGEYIVEIGGTQGTGFGGTCLSVAANRNTSHDASGTVPLTFALSGDVVSCAVQRKTGAGHLSVVIKDASGRVVAESSAVQPFGVVMAAGR